MKYRNIDTGMVVDVPSKLKGCWEPLEVPASPALVEKTEPEGKSKTVTVKKPIRKAAK